MQAGRQADIIIYSTTILGEPGSPKRDVKEGILIPVFSSASR